ncbi:hypothetical protein AALA83_17235 [Oscillospiraceae bacterium 44-5]
MSFYKTCPHCGANLDSGEQCNCIPSMYARLSPENHTKIDAFVHSLVQKQLRDATVAKARETFPERFTGKTDREVVVEISTVVKRAAQGATNTEDGKVEHVDHAVSTSDDTTV